MIAVESAAPPQRRLRQWLLVVVLLLVTFALGARGLNVDVIWSDEYYSLIDSGLLSETPSSVVDIWNRVAVRNPWHAPGFFMLLSGWGRLVGRDPAMLRALSLLCGVLTVAWTYRLGRDFISPRVGLYAAIVLGTAGYFIYYQHEIRMYTLVTMLTAAMLWLYLSVMRGPSPGKGAWLGLFVVALVMPYVHYYCAIPLAGIAVYHVLLGWRRRQAQGLSRRWWGVVVVLAAAGLLFLPWFGTFISGIDKAVDNETLHTLALSNTEVVTWFLSLFSNGHVVLFLALLILAVLGVRQRRIGWLLIIVVVMVGLMLLSNWLLELLKPSRIRYMILFWPLLSLLVAVGMTQLRRWRGLPPVLLGLWLVLTLTSSTVPDFFASLDAAEYVYPTQHEAHYLRDHAQPGDYVLNYMRTGTRLARYDRLTEYYFEHIPVSVRNFAMIYEAPALQDALHTEAVDSIGDSERLWFSYTPGQVPPVFDEFVERIQSRYIMCGVTRDEPNLRLELYARSPVCCLPDTRTPTDEVVFGNRLAVTGADVQYVPQEGNLSVVLGWHEIGEVPLHVYSATIRVYDAGGTQLGQFDYGLEPSVYACRRAYIPVDDLPPGTYDVRVGVYAWQTGESLPGEDPQDGTQGDILTVTTFDVLP